MSYACFLGGKSSTNSNASKFNMFCNSSSRPTFNSSSGNCPLSAVRSRLRSTVGMSHRRLLTAATQPANELSFALDPCSDSLLLGVSAVELDASPGLISGSPISSFSNLHLALPQFLQLPQFKLHHPCPPFFVQFLLGIPLPDSKTTWASCSASILVQNIQSQVHSFTRLPLSNSSFCWIAGVCCVLLPVAFHGLPAHRFNNCKFQALSPSRRLTQRVFIAPVGVNRRNSSVRSSLPTKTPRIDLMFKLAPSSNFSKWHHICSVVLAPDRTTRRSPGTLHLEIDHSPWIVSNHPAHQHMIRSNFCLLFH